MGTSEEQPSIVEDVIDTVKRKGLKGVLHNALTGPDNVTHDVSRILLFLTVIAAIGFEGYVVVITHTFDIVDFGSGMAALLGFGAGGVAIKHFTEPQQQQ